MLNRGQNANFIESILAFFDGERVQRNLLESVNLRVCLPAHFEHLAERSTSELLNNLELLYAHLLIAYQKSLLFLIYIYPIKI